MENNLTQPKEVDITFSLVIMSKMELYQENNSLILLSPMTTVGSYSENKLFKPLSPVRRNYPKIIINNSLKFYYGRLKKELVGTKLCSSTISLDKALSTVRLLNAALYECVDIEIQE